MAKPHCGMPRDFESARARLCICTSLKVLDLELFINKRIFYRSLLGCRARQASARTRPPARARPRIAGTESSIVLEPIYTAVALPPRSGLRCPPQSAIQPRRLRALPRRQTHFVRGCGKNEAPLSWAPSLATCVARRPQARSKFPRREALVTTVRRSQRQRNKI